MSEANDAIPFESLATLNEDGGITKLVVGPMLVILAVVALIAVVRFVQRQRERAAMEASLKE